MVVGTPTLHPGNIAWLGAGDAATQYLGWQFFRAAPWSWPPGANPSYGLELASSVVYSDSIAGLALLFKLFDGALPGTFQYFGLWQLACFALQALLGWKLMTLISERPSVRILGAGLILFAPPFLWRIGVHPSLAAHWLILAALYLCLRPRETGRMLGWALVLGAAVMVHAYLWAMALALWLADFVARFPGRERSGLIEPPLMAALSLVAMWLCGYFVLPAGALSDSAPLYGAYRMNLLSPLDAGGWSHVLPDLPSATGELEGFNFLGLGTILLALAALGRARRLGPIALAWRYRPLLAVLLGLTLLAVSHKPGIAAMEPFVFPLPPSVESALSVFQASGRFFWPVFYAVVLCTLWLLVRAFSHRTAAALLGAALLVQIIDTRAGWHPVRQRLNVAGSEWQTVLKSPFWDDAAARYRTLRWVPATNHSRHWQDLAYYAARHRMATDAVYLARVDYAAVTASRRAALQAVRSGSFDPGTLYLFDPSFAAWSDLRGPDVFGDIDGFIVLAPGWKR